MREFEFKEDRGLLYEPILRLVIDGANTGICLTPETICDLYRSVGPDVRTELPAIIIEELSGYNLSSEERLNVIKLVTDFVNGVMGQCVEL